MDELEVKYQNMVEMMITYAMLFVGTPYKYGGDNPIFGFDCSGFILEAYRGTGQKAPDTTAQGIYNMFPEKKTVKQVSRGDFIFFGPSIDKISHVALALNSEVMIEAGGGDHTTVDLVSAASKNAFVRQRPIDNRKDLIGVVKPRFL